MTRRASPPRRSLSKERRNSQEMVNVQHESSMSHIAQGGDRHPRIMRLPHHVHDDHPKASDRAVYLVRVMMGLVLLASSVSCALLIYRYASDAEASQFETRFSQEASTVLDAVTGSLYVSMGAFDAFALAMVSHAARANQTYPFVVIPDYAVRAAKIRSLSQAICIYYYLKVEASERAAWEAFSVSHDDWVREGLEVQRRDETYHGVLYDTYRTNPYIHTNNGQPVTDDSVYEHSTSSLHTTTESNSSSPPSQERFYLPNWQSYPVVPVYAPYNWNAALYGPVWNSVPALFYNKSVVMQVANFPSPDQHPMISEADADVASTWGRAYIGADQDATEPLVDIFYPISTDALNAVSQVNQRGSAADDNRGSSSNNNNNSSSSSSSVVGILTASLYWRVLLEGILQEGTGGVVAVFEMGQAVFTYAINGPDATYIGRGDLHDVRYDGWQRSTTLASSSGAGYTGLPLSAFSQTFQMHVYPSIEMENVFVTKDPLIYTIAAVLAFLFTTGLFIMYDRCTEHRQRKTMHTVVQTEASVALLEAMVRERTRALEESHNRMAAASAAQLQHFAAMSHEIRTPMNGIIGLSSLMEDTQLDPWQTETMKMIISSGELLVAVVNDVLDYSKLESGKFDICVTKTALQDALSSTVQSVQIRGCDRHVSVQTFYDPSIPEHVMTDPRRLQQILFNLLGNAIKFSKPGGTVELSVFLCDERTPEEGAFIPTNCSDRSSLPVTSETAATGGTAGMFPHRLLSFVVKDYGRGIRQEDLQEIFHPFAQAERNTSSHIECGGTGLGLAITERLVRALGGNISVRSEWRQWSEFRVDLPFHEDSAVLDNEVNTLQKARILLVSIDDQESDRIVYLFNHFSVRIERFTSLKDITKISVPKDTRPRLWLVDEQAYTNELPDMFERDDLLVTFGPRFIVRKCRSHYRSLTSILPSALLRQLAELLEDKQGKHRSTGVPESLPEEYIANDASVVETNYNELRFLIAEDNKVNQKVLKSILNRLGFNNVDVVDNGRAAVEAEAQTPYDLIWMDMQMPIMDGEEACRLIRARQAGDHPVPKIIFATAHVQEHIETECMASGAIGFLPKPCNVKSVKACLTKILPEFTGIG